MKHIAEYRKRVSRISPGALHVFESRIRSNRITDIGPGSLWTWRVEVLVDG
jgi:hypothetical protein